MKDRFEKHYKTQAICCAGSW